MPRYNIYLKQDAENNLRVIFAYLKSIGDIPANADDIGKYRAQCITFAIHYMVGALAVDPDIEFIETLKGRGDNE